MNRCANMKKLRKENEQLKLENSILKINNLQMRNKLYDVHIIVLMYAQR